MAWQYFDFEYRDEQGKNRTFRFHRFVPLLEARVSDRVSFQTEVEIEDGSDLAIEFAHLDYLLTDSISLRTGVILLPQGRLNLVHDSPIQEFTDRPLVNRLVIPSTLRDTGIGVHGRLGLAGDDEEADPAGQDQKSYLARDQTGAGRPRLSGEGLFGIYSLGESTVKFGG